MLLFLALLVSLLLVLQKSAETLQGTAFKLSGFGILVENWPFWEGFLGKASQALVLCLQKGYGCWKASVSLAKRGFGCKNVFENVT